MQQTRPGNLHHQIPTGHAQGQKAPFWVRYYDFVTNLVTLGRAGAVHEQTLSLADLHPGDAVLDVGCGTGKLLLRAETIVGGTGSLLGLDVEPEMIRQARDHAWKAGSRAVFEVASIAEMPFAAATFDVVLSTLMMHHLAPDVQAAGITEAARVLKPGGRFLVVDINRGRRGILTALPGHAQMDRRDHVCDDVTRMMALAGLEVVASGAHPSRQLSYALAQKPHQTHERRADHETGRRA